MLNRNPNTAVSVVKVCLCFAEVAYYYVLLKSFIKLFIDIIYLVERCSVFVFNVKYCSFMQACEVFDL